MRDYDEVDLFTDVAVSTDPEPYFEHLRAKGPAVRLPNGVVAVTDYEAGLAVWRDDERFSAFNAVASVAIPLPFTPQGDDISAEIEAHRSAMPGGFLIATQDPPAHEKIKSLLMGMITPKRLKENEAFMLLLADQTIDEFIGRGRVEVVGEYGRPFATLVIADLLGVPEEDHKTFRTLVGGVLPGAIGAQQMTSNNPLEQIGMHFYGYVEDRRRALRKDVLTDLAHQRYADGSLPEVADVVAVATFLFAAGQDTTVRLFAAMLRFLAEDLELQKRLRQERHRIPDFVEEVLRLEGTVRSNFRLAKVPAKVGDLAVEPGAPVMIIGRAMNRDPRRFEDPNTLNIDRRNLRDNVAFGRGRHACPGAPLARAEAKVTLERLFDRTAEIRIDEAAHGPEGARRFEIEPSYMFRGLKALHLEFTA
jgi:cytochrome P450